MNKLAELRLAFFIALRYVRQKRGNRFISFLSLSSAIGIALGVAVLIIVMSVMNGFQTELHTRILGMVPHVTVIKSGPANSPIENWSALAARLRALPGVSGVAPLIKMQGMLSYRGAVEGVELHGVLPEKEAEVSVFPAHMIKGQLRYLKLNDRALIVGSALAKRLGLNMGDEVTFIYPQATRSGSGVIPRFKQFQIVGIFSVGSEYDHLFVATHIDSAGAFLNRPELVTSVQLRLTDLYQAPKLRQQIQTLLGDSYKVSDWSITQGNFFRAVSLEKSMMGFLLLLIVAIAAFNMVSGLVMLVTDKTVDIAILRTLGASNKVIVEIFMIQGMLGGFMGTFIGAGVGVVVAMNMTAGLKYFESVFHSGIIDSYFLSYLPSQIEWMDVVLITACAMLMSLLATLYPARKASEIEPVEAFHYD